jgi:hypothetical protein
MRSTIGVMMALAASVPIEALKLRIACLIVMTEGA